MIIIGMRPRKKKKLLRRFWGGRYGVTSVGEEKHGVHRAVEKNSYSGGEGLGIVRR